MKQLFCTLLALMGLCLYPISSLGETRINEGIQKWSFKTDGSVISSPSIGPDGIIYVGSNDGNIYAIKPDGSLKWKFHTKGAVHSRPALGPDGTVYFGSWDRNLYALNPDGSLKWEFPTNGTVSASPTIGSDGTIYFSSWDQNIYAVRPDGSLKWMFSTNAEVFSSPVIGPDNTIYVGSWDHHLYALNGSPDEASELKKEPSKVSALPPSSTFEKKSTLEVRQGLVFEDPSFNSRVKFEIKKGEQKESTSVGVWKEIRIENTPGSDEKFIFVLNDHYAPRVFFIGGDRPRLFFDFFGAQPGRAISPRIMVNGDTVRQIRHAFHRDPKPRTRVVLDLVSNKKPDFEKKFLEQENLFILIVKSSRN